MRGLKAESRKLKAKSRKTKADVGVLAFGLQPSALSAPKEQP